MTRRLSTRRSALTITALFITAVTSAHAETVTYFATDHLGSPVAAMDSSGNLLWQEGYSPYGEKLEEPSGADNDSGYTGHQFDAATDLTYMQARYYDPVIGRFMAVDPVEFDGRNPAHFGRYTYGYNSPYKYIDPDGRAAFSIGVDVQGSIFGMGFGVTAKVAASVSKQPGGGWTTQVGYTGGTQTSAAGAGLQFNKDMGIVEKGAAIIAAIFDSGVSAATEAGVFVGTAENPADVEDLGGTSIEFGGAISKKHLGKVAEKLPGPSVTGEFKSGENGIKGIELGFGAGIGGTFDLEDAAEPTLIYDKDH